MSLALGLSFFLLLGTSAALLCWACVLLAGGNLPAQVAHAFARASEAGLRDTVAGARVLLRPFDQDQMNRKVRQLVMQERVAFVKVILPMVVGLNALILAFDFFDNSRWSLPLLWWHSPADGSAWKRMFEWSLVQFRLFVSVIVLYSPRMNSSPSWIRVAIGCAFLRLTVEAATIDEVAYPVWLASSIPIRILASLLHGELCADMCFNVLVSVASCLRHGWAAWHVKVQLYICLATAASLYSLEHARVSQSKAILEARTSHSIEVAADGLLSRMCDAVVHLGEDLCVKRPSQQLAALLLRHSRSGLSGVPFRDLCASSQESERVRGFLLREDRSADALHTSLRDGSASAVKVQLFHISGRDLDDLVFHIVGVREDSESFRQPPEAEYGTVALAPGALREHVPTEVESVRTLSEEGGSAGLAVYFDAGEAGWPIVKCSASFTSLSGPSPHGTKLLEWVVRPAQMRGCVQRLLHDARCSDSLDILREYMQVRLQPPHVGRLRTQLLARAELSIDRGGAVVEGDLSVDGGRRWTVKAVLDNIKEVKPRRQEHVALGRAAREACGSPGSSHTARSAGEFSSRASEHSALDAELRVFFSVHEDGYPIKKLSLSSGGRPTPEMNMLSWVGEADAEPFITACQEIVMQFHTGDKEAARRSIDMSFRPLPFLKTSAQELRVRAELTLDHNNGIEDPRQRTVQASLRELVKVRRRRHEQPRSEHDARQRHRSSEGERAASAGDGSWPRLRRQQRDDPE